ncbi:MAG TPA: sn-glycerol-3-phosphate ABC transporter ATP-binding protein UgpC [Gemmatimonadales bacterium]|jgi:ABC-type sugar transport system ATPase subunit|nr:sn-glycerol-3-phosphate ABC transporter ATP-binding protein UgpC [Gemmatimonadales bacterium]
MASVTLVGVQRIYPGPPPRVAVDGLDLRIEDGEFVVLVGPSGCGKSTTLRMIAGLEPVSAGQLSIGDRLMNDVAPKDRDVAMVFQNYALYPHMTAYRNMAFNLQLRGLPKDDIDARVRDAASTLRIEHLLDCRPRQLSGGEQQRVALGRALVRNPAVFLFDEPLSNLDAKLRVEMRREIARLHRQLGATMVYVTHDQAEAMTLGNRIVVMHGGRVQQVGKPLDVYRHPRNTFVAGFIGSPPMNLIPGRLTPDGSLFVSDGGVFSFPPPPEWRTPLAGSGGRAVVLGVRPEHVSLSGSGPAIAARVDLVEPLGQEVLVYTTASSAAAASEITARLAAGPVPVTGETATIHLDPAGMVFFDAEMRERIA